jgi:phycocyanobilin lyase alpha subunit
LDSGYGIGLGVMEPLNEMQVINNLRQTEDPSAQYYAAWWLGKMRSRHPDAIPLLLKALETLNDTPIDPERRGVALNAIRALALLRDARAEDHLLVLLSSSDYTVREEAVRTLGAMGSRQAVDAIRALLSSGVEGAGQEQTSSPLLNEPCEALLEALGDIGDASSSNIAVIQPFTEHPRPLIRSAACRALLQLTALDQWGVELKKLLDHPEPLVRRGALLDLGATGWIAAVPSIRSAAVEPSLKLVALRELAEHNDDPDEVLDAMDGLL